MALKTVSLVAGFLFVTLGTVVHFHAVPGMLFKAPDVFPPDITAVAGNPVFLIGSGFGGISDMPVTGNTVHPSHFGVGGVGKEDAVRLPGIDQPGDLFFLENVLFDKNRFILGLAKGLFRMAFQAGIQLGNTGKGAVLAVKVTGITATGFAHVKGMVKIKRLLLF